MDVLFPSVLLSQITPVNICHPKVTSKKTKLKITGEGQSAQLTEKNKAKRTGKKVVGSAKKKRFLAS